MTISQENTSGSRLKIFEDNFEALHLEFKGDWAKSKSPAAFGLMMGKYYDLSIKLKTEDIKAFMRLFNKFFPTTEQWRNELASFLQKKYPVREEESDNEPDDPKWKALRAELAPIMMNKANYREPGELKDKCRPIYKKHGIKMPEERS